MAPPLKRKRKKKKVGREEIGFQAVAGGNCQMK